MTTYLEEHRALFPRLSCPPPFRDDRRACRPYHVIGPPQPPSALPTAPPAPLLCPAPQHQPTPPSQYPPPHRPDAPPHLPRPYNTYVAPTPSPRTSEPTYFLGSWSRDKFIDLTSYMLDTAAELNNDFVALPIYTQPESVYFSVSRPDIPTKDYVRRLVTYTRCSPAAFIVMLIYIDRIATANRLLLVTPYNMHRLLVTALTLASKYLDDRCYSNVHYAKVGGIPSAREMNRLELQYLKYLGFKLHVEPEEYNKKLYSLMQVSPPSSPTSVVFHTSPVTSASSSPTSITAPIEQRSPMPVNRTLDFDGRYAMVRMLDDNPGVDVSVDSSHPRFHKLGQYAQHHSAKQRINYDRWFQGENSHGEASQGKPSQRAMRRSSRHDGKHTSSLDPRFYRATHPSAMPVRYAECAP